MRKFNKCLVQSPNSGISYFHGVSSKPLIYSTLGAQLEKITHKFPNNIALISQHQEKALTYIELFQKAQKIAASFLALGLKKHDRIACYAPNCYQWYLVEFAAAMANLILVNINPAYQTSELEYALNKVQCKALVTASKFKSSDYMEIIENIAPEIRQSSPGQLNSIKLPHLKTLIKMDDKKTNGYFNFSDLYDFYDSSHILELNKIKIDPDDPTNIQFTSGTTGKPKGATLSHLNILNNGYFIGERLNYTSEDRICVSVPLYHCFAMVLGNLGALTRGASVVYPSDSFSAKETLKAISRFQCTSVYVVPKMFIDCLNELKDNGKKYPNVLVEEKKSKNLKKINKSSSVSEILFEKQAPLNYEYPL